LLGNDLENVWGRERIREEKVSLPRQEERPETNFAVAKKKKGRIEGSFFGGEGQLSTGFQGLGKKMSRQKEERL